MFARSEKIPSSKLTFVQYFILAIFLVLAYGLWRLQVANNDRYGELAERNRIRNVPILAPRGKLLDREGRTIVDNYPSFSVLLLKDQLKNGESLDIPAIAAGLNMSSGDIEGRLRRFRNTPQIVLKDDITPDELAFVKAHRYDLPYLETIMVARRLYPKNGFAAHMVGYVGEVSEEMLDLPQYEFNKAGDVVGQSGIEKQYNAVLMGENGSRRAIVNSRGKEVGSFPDKPATPGRNLKLTIDLDVQIAAEQALEGENGAIVAMDPRSGEILAMVSRPTFDPNAFAVRISSAEWNRLISDEANPLLNKAIQAQLAPGSVYKIMMAMAGLEEGIAQDMTVNCGGGREFYGRFFGCWIRHKGGGHGSVNLDKGIYQSCDVFFYTLGERLGIDRIARWGTAFGLGRKTGIDLPNEVSGLQPSEEWKIKSYKQKWYAGETISVSIGQGAVQVTPIQLARMIGGIAMGGKLVRPHLVSSAEMPDQLRQVAFKSEGIESVPVRQQDWERVTDAMAQVVSPVGTAGASRLQNIDFGGKTGSAQVVSNDALKKLGKSAKYHDNAWFVGVAPRRNPEIVVSVLVEAGLHGSDAARLASQVIKAYVEKQRKVENFVAGTRDRFSPPDFVARKTTMETASIKTRGSVEVGGGWGAGAVPAHDAHDHANGDALRAGRMVVPVSAQPKRSRSRQQGEKPQQTAQAMLPAPEIRDHSLAGGTQ